ncbi:MAG: DUF4402 domain-containing protein, partial [Bacteroidales bacterium]|nr:DUF4402 domain-containing protein [Bacteroidales bacterium]
MKKTLLLSATLLLVTFFSQNSYATWVPGGTTDGEASAHIIQPLEISKVADLKFGNIAAGPSAGTVVIATDDARTK